MPSVPAEAATLDEQDWLHAVNRARSDAGLSPARARNDWTRPAVESSRYIVRNNVITHRLDPKGLGYTEDAAWAARTGNLAVMSGGRRTPVGAIDRWLNSPAHASWVLHPHLTEVGYGEYHDPDLPRGVWSWAATLPVTDGVDRRAPYPQRFNCPAEGVKVYRDLVRLYVFGASLPQGTYRVTTTANGVAIPASAQLHSSRQLVISYGSPLPARARIAVHVRRDGQPFESFAFSTRGAADDLTPPPLAPWDGKVPSCDGTPVGTYPDVPTGSTHAQGVGCAAGLGLVQGFADGTFGPAITITRAQVATILDRAFAISGPRLPPGTPRFTDVTGPHADAIHRLADAGVIHGRTPSRFDPSAPVTRAQLMSLLDRASREVFSTPLPLVALNPFTDTEPPHDAAIARANGVGIADGYAGGTFRPGGSVRRDHAASFITRWLDWRFTVAS